MQRDQRAAFELMFRSYYAEVCDHIHRYISETEIVQDVAQEIFTELWRKRDNLEITGSYGVYLYRMAGSRALNYIRDNKKHWFSDESGLIAEETPLATPDSTLQASELSEIITKAIDSLPERCRIVFMLSRYDGMTNAQIASHLEISVKTVENQMTKALRVLRNVVKVYNRE